MCVIFVRMLFILRMYDINHCRKFNLIEKLHFTVIMRGSTLKDLHQHKKFVRAQQFRYIDIHYIILKHTA